MTNRELEDGRGHRKRLQECVSKDLICPTRLHLTFGHLPVMPYTGNQSKGVPFTPSEPSPPHLWTHPLSHTQGCASFPKCFLIQSQRQNELLHIAWFVVQDSPRREAKGLSGAGTLGKTQWGRQTNGYRKNLRRRVGGGPVLV